MLSEGSAIFGAIMFSLHVYLSVKRLDQIRDHLWWAGRPHAARPLHKQKLLMRQIVITEQADLHILWLENRIFIKPFPSYLLDRNVWKEHICKDVELFEAARGMLLSYMWLIRTKSDLDIAHDHRLLSENITWKSWCAIVEDVQNSFDLNSPQAVSRRYDFGELRIRRINQIARLKALRSLRVYDFIKGYTQTYTHYGYFFSTNFHWIILVFAFGSILLSALQLKIEIWFQNMSVGFTMFLVAFPIFLIAFTSLLFLALFTYFLGHSLRLNRKRINKGGGKGKGTVPKV
ncbi:hypothetical protein GQ44DRAFT_745473 [Phaeosphaeriaceae sp. PMI808]|nr:hypothetical protein GQ44DRAFT_745473 [Phaeosphaeriaceae sp. PMI808]